MKMTKAKALVAALGTVVTVLTGVLADDVLNVGEIGEVVSTLVTGAITVWAVWGVPNKPAETPSQYR